MFSESFDVLPVGRLLEVSRTAGASDVGGILRKGKAGSLEEFAALLSPAAGADLENMAGLSQQITRRHFGKVVRLFAPLYLSNECVNICKYCGFSRNNEIPRTTVPPAKVGLEAGILAGQGFRSLLLVAGEHPRHVSKSYLKECLGECIAHVPSLLLEIAPMETQDYLPLARAGCEGIVVYQETYHQPTYKDLHPHGPKKHFHWRLDSAERAYAAGFRRLGIGALFGLYNWQYEAICLAAHALHLGRFCCNSQLSISFPRMRPASGEFEPAKENILPDRQLVQLVCALRMLLPHAAFVLSTREPASFRDGLIPLGITNISAGSCTEPGGYSSYDRESWKQGRDQPGEQFKIADERSPSEMARLLRQLGLEPVWKDFDTSLVTAFPPNMPATGTCH